MRILIELTDDLLPRSEAERDEFLKSVATAYAWLCIYKKELDKRDPNPQYHSLTLYGHPMRVLRLLDNVNVDLTATQSQSPLGRPMLEVANNNDVLLENLFNLLTRCLVRPNAKDIADIFQRSKIAKQQSDILNLRRYQGGGFTFRFRGKMEISTAPREPQPIEYHEPDPEQLFLRAVISSLPLFSNPERVLHIAFLRLYLEDFLLVELSRLISYRDRVRTMQLLKR